MSFPKVAQLKTVDALRRRCLELKIDLPVDDQPLSAAKHSPLAESFFLGPHRVGNRWCVQPMEGWDGNPDGSPSPHMLRRWRRFGLSGAKLIWGGEAAAVVPEGRANPNQLLALPENRSGLSELLQTLASAHEESFAAADGLLVGLQLTHSGRYCRPHSKQLEPCIAYHHPLLDARCGIDPRDDSVVISDDQIETLVDQYVASALLAQEVGFSFVDVKCCHGYLLHEFLSARRRPGKYGGDYAGRTRLLKTIIGRIQQACPHLTIAVRLSVIDFPPFAAGENGSGPVDLAGQLPYELGFGVSAENPLQYDLAEPLRLIGELKELGVAAINITCGSPYYCPHIQRPAIFPPSDGYPPPEDPLAGVARQIEVSRLCQQAFPGYPLVGSGYSYLQDFLPHVAQAAVRNGWITSVGIGRMVLSYPTLPADVLAGGELKRKLVCRTFSDCTTGPRLGLLSGCFPLDSYYKKLPEAELLKAGKRSV